jgi:hypothetical protein
MPWTVLQPQRDAAIIARANSRTTLFSIVLSPLSKMCVQDQFTKLGAIVAFANAYDNHHYRVPLGAR